MRTFFSDSELTPETVYELSREKTIALHLSESLHRRLISGFSAFQKYTASGKPVYGISTGFSTGFGPFVHFQGIKAENQGENLLEHLAAGTGNHAECRIIRMAILLRCRTLSLGYSAVHPDLLQTYASMLQYPGCPAVPETGSVGASGDLVPLAHIARVITGKGMWISGKGAVPVSEHLIDFPFRPSLTPREALSLVNGLSVSLSYAVISVHEAFLLVQKTEEITGFIYALLGARAEALHPGLHQAKGHPGQILSARSLLYWAGHYGHTEEESRNLQEIYSLRTAPQILGAVRDQLQHAYTVLKTEINGADDNPLFTEAGVIHGGNFQGQHIAFAADSVHSAVLQLAQLNERLFAAVCDPAVNGGAPLLLSPDPEKYSGLAGLQLTLASVLSRARGRAVFHANLTFPTNGGNQDIVSNAANAAQAAFETVKDARIVTAGLGIAAVQLNHLLPENRKKTGIPSWISGFTPLDRDRALQDDLRKISEDLFN